MCVLPCVIMAIRSQSNFGKGGHVHTYVLLLLLLLFLLLYMLYQNMVRRKIKLYTKK